MSVVELKTRASRINAEAISLLKDHLAKAEAGEIEAVALASVLSDGSCLTTSSANDHFQALLGAISILQHRMIDEVRTSLVDP
jgi:hypothetical protein